MKRRFLRKSFWCQVKTQLSIGRSDQGQSIVLMAFFVVVLFGFGSMVLDAGYLYLQQERLQAAVDAGALAGAQTLALGQSSVVSEAQTTAATNYPSSGDYNVTVASSQVDVTRNLSVPLWFARIWGDLTQQIQVTAKAQVNPVYSAKGVLPIGVPSTTYDMAESSSTPISITNGAGSSQMGNFGFLQYPAPYSSTTSPCTDVNGHINTLACDLTYGYPDPVSINESGVTTYTGNDTASSAVNTSMTNLVGQVVTVPIVDTLDVSGSNQPITINGFASFLITAFGGTDGQGHYTLQAQLVHSVNGGTDSPSGAPNYGTYSVTLVQ